jgi:hypothetical protein
MAPGLSAMGENVGVGAAGLLKGVGEEWQAVEGPLIVDELAQLA